jgi:hypothetical protein
MYQHELYFLGQHDAHRAYIYILANITRNLEKSNGKIIFSTVERLNYITQVVILQHVNCYDVNFNRQDVHVS